MPQRIVVAGIGAIGTLIAGRLAAQQHDVALVARGERRAELIRDGLRWANGSGKIDNHSLAVGDMRDFSGPDVLIIATKSQALPMLLPSLAPHLRPDTLVVPLINGLPWWYRTRQPLSALDPDGTLAGLIGRSSIIGTVVYVNACLRDGIAHATGLNRLELGGVDGGQHEGCSTIAELLSAAGVGISQPADIRASLWQKAALNYATNTLSVVTGATLSELFANSATAPIVAALLDEIRSLAEIEGYAVPATEKLFPIGIAAGAVETSMLQDFKAGKAIEIDALAHAFIELAEQYGRSMPTGKAIAELASYHVHHRDEAVQPI